MSKSSLAMGLMSGTSTDGIDGVVLRIAGASEVAIQCHAHWDFSPELRAQINALINQPRVELDELGQLHAALGETYAQLANQLAHQSEAEIAVIGCHGQTVRHAPNAALPFSLQLGCGARIAARTGIPVVSDFRSADIAHGGQGAPLAPAFHHAVFAHEKQTRAIVNLGGIANITHLPAAETTAESTTAAEVLGFDTGPGNTLLDAWCQRHFDAAFDAGGEIATSAEPNSPLLNALLGDPYFAQSPPKSSGREYFNLGWLDNILAKANATDLPPEAVQATLTALTAESVARAVAGLRPKVTHIFICGGGVENRAVLKMLAQRSALKIATTDALGIPPQLVEASAFAWMAARTMERRPAVLPSVTGATRPSIAGAIYYP